MNKSWMTIGIIFGALTLPACQTLSLPSSKSNYVSKSSNSYESENHEPPVTLVPPIPDSDCDGVLDHIDYCPKTPINTIIDKKGCPIAKNLMGPLALEIKTYFEQGSAKFSREGYATDIDNTAEKLIEYAEYDYLPIVILGHISMPEAQLMQEVDDKQANGNFFNNEQLAQNRAQLVKDQLISRGISASRVYTYDCGTHYQIAENDTEANIHMNQRVFGWSAVEDENYIVCTHNLEGYQEKCKAFNRDKQ